jgi:hypothetical protein
VELCDERATSSDDVCLLALRTVAPEESLKSHVKPLQHHLLAESILRVHGLENIRKKRCIITVHEGTMNQRRARREQLVRRELTELCKEKSGDRGWWCGRRGQRHGLR